MSIEVGQAPRPRRRGGWEALLAVLFLSGLAVTAQVWMQAQRADLRVEAERFDRLTGLTGRLVEDHLRLIDGALGSARGLILGSRQVEQVEWRRFAESLRERGGLPGVVELAFVVDGEPSGDRIRPEVRLRELAGPECPDLSTGAFVDAARSARDSKRSTLADPTGAPPDGPRVHLLLPVYKTDAPIDTPQRRDDHRGWVCAWIDLPALLDAVLGPDVDLLRARLIAAAPGASGAILFDSASKDPDGARFSSARSVAIGDRAWTLEMSSRPAFDAARGGSHLWILAVGVLLSVAIWLGGRAMVVSRDRALRIAADRTEEMRTTEGRYREVFLGGAQAQLLLRPDDGRILDANPAAARFYGYDRERLRRMRLADLCSRGEEDADRITVAADAVAVARERRIRQRLSSGLVREVEIIACPIRVSGSAVVHASIRDVTERHEIERIQQITARVFETAAEAILVTDRAGRILMVNPAFSRISGYSAAEARGRDLAVLEAGLNPRPLLLDIQRSLVREGTWVGEVLCRRKDGEVHLGRLAISDLAEEGERPERRVVVFSDLSVSQRDGARETRVARYDPLTGLPDRALFLDRLEREVARARRNAAGIALLVIDLDGFRGVNETSGHEIGDRVLRAIAERLGESVRDADTVARLGGDEFAVVVPAVRRATVAAAVAERLHGIVAAPVPADTGSVGLTGSIGVARYPDDGADAEHLLRHAETALSRAKSSGKNRVRFFSTESDRVARERAASIGDLLRALDRGELVLHWQPIWDLRTSRITDAEALLRWHHPERGLLAPERFLTDLTDTRLVAGIASWVARETCARASDWRSRGIDVGASFNVNGSELRDADWLEALRESIASFGIPPHRVAIELSETTMIRQASRLGSALHRLHEDGIDVHVERAGREDPGLRYLDDLPIDRIKIDTARMIEASSHGDRVRGVLEAAALRGILVCGQDVETAERLRAFRDLGGRCAQGYLLGGPMPLERFEQRLERDDGIR